MLREERQQSLDQEERRLEIGGDESVERLLGPFLDREMGDVGGVAHQDVELWPLCPRPQRITAE